MAPKKEWAALTQLRFVPVKKSNIVAFVKQYMKFYDAKGESADRRDAEFFWAYEVRKVYSKDEPEFERLLSQVNCPANEQFWAERMDPSAAQHRHQLQLLSTPRVFPREPTTAESVADPGLLILSDGSYTVLLPGYNLKPVTAINFPHFVVTLLMRNPWLYLTHDTITELWSTLVLQVYHFEPEDVKSAKLSEMEFHPNVAPPATSTAVPTPTPAMAGWEIEQGLRPGAGSFEGLRQNKTLLAKENALREQRLKSLKGRVRKWQT